MSFNPNVKKSQSTDKLVVIAELLDRAREDNRVKNIKCNIKWEETAAGILLPLVELEIEKCD